MKRHYLKLCAIVLLVGTLWSPNVNTSAKVYAPAPPELEEPAPDALDLWLEKLAGKESQGRSTFAENRGLPYIVDVNGYRSYSCLQFQLGTFQGYWPLLGSSTPVWAEAVTDCGLQKQLARAMILDHYGNWAHWLNSTRKIGLPPKI